MAKKIRQLYMKYNSRKKLGLCRLNMKQNTSHFPCVQYTDTTTDITTLQYTVALTQQVSTLTQQHYSTL